MAKSQQVETFRVPPNLRKLRDCRRTRITLGGKSHAVSFVHYLKLNAYGVVLFNNGLVLIGQVEGGKWQARLCEKVARKTFSPVGLDSPKAETPKDAWIKIAPMLDKLLKQDQFEEAPF